MIAAAVLAADRATKILAPGIPPEGQALITMSAFGGSFLFVISDTRSVSLSVPPNTMSLSVISVPSSPGRSDDGRRDPRSYSARLPVLLTVCHEIYAQLFGACISTTASFIWMLMQTAPLNAQP